MSNTSKTRVLFNNLKNKVFDTKQSATLAAHQLQTTSNLKRHAKQNHEKINFGFGQSPFSPPQYLKDSLSKASTQKLNHYAPVSGLPELQKAICEFHNQKYNLDFSEQNTLIMPGSKQGMFTILKSFKPGTLQVYLPAPSWVSYSAQAKICDQEFIYLPTTHESKWKINATQLDNTFYSHHDNSKQKLLILTSPDNPTGLSYPDDKLKEIAEILKKHEAIVISDEIYSLLKHDDSHSSIANFYPEGTIISTGISKSMGAGGWRLGTIMLPDELAKNLKDPIIGVSSEIHSAVATPIQKAAVSAFTENQEITNHIKNQQELLKKLGSWCQNKLNSPQIRVNKPDGAFYLFLDFMPIKEDLAKKYNIHNSADLCKHLKDNLGVLLLAGDEFGLHPEHLSARLAYVDFDGDLALAAINPEKKDDILDEQFFSTFCKNTVNGVNILSSWASQFSSSNEFEIPVRQSTKKNSYKDNIEPFSQFLQLTQYRSENTKKSISDTTHNLINI